MDSNDAYLRPSRLSAVDVDELRPFVVDLENGIFSGLPGASGHAALKSVPADVDRIFTQYLPAFVESRGGKPTSLVFWAHGGLVNEGSALAATRRYIPWWLANGIYPIHFVWHSGFWDTLGDLLADHAGELWKPSEAGGVKGDTGLGPVGGPVAAGVRVLDSPVTDLTNKLIEELLRRVGGPAVWSAMKENARRASGPGGGAAYVAAAVAAFQNDFPGMAVVHAAGFSAGANFHQHFVPVLVRSNIDIETCTLLVPAMGTQEFKEVLMPLLGHGVERMAVFGMNTELARADNSFGVYRGSVLQLISAALEATPNSPILGLQECINSDPVLDAFFKVAPAVGPAAAVWSVTATGPLDARSSATTHTAFDEDVPTMDSVVRRIAGRESIISFGAAAHARLLSVAANTTR